MKQTGMTLLEQKQMSIMEKMENELKEDKDNKSQDPEYLYAQSLAAELRNFGEVERCMIKHEINNIIFKYQMNKYRDLSSSNTSTTFTDYPIRETPSRVCNEMVWPNSCYQTPLNPYSQSCFTENPDV